MLMPPPMPIWACAVAGRARSPNATTQPRPYRIVVPPGMSDEAVRPQPHSNSEPPFRQITGGTASACARAERDAGPDLPIRHSRIATARATKKGPPSSYRRIHVECESRGTIWWVWIKWDGSVAAPSPRLAEYGDWAAGRGWAVRKGSISCVLPASYWESPGGPNRTRGQLPIRPSFAIQASMGRMEPVGRVGPIEPRIIRADRPSFCPLYRFAARLTIRASGRPSSLPALRTITCPGRWSS